MLNIISDEVILFINLFQNHIIDGIAIHCRNVLFMVLYQPAVNVFGPKIVGLVLSNYDCCLLNLLIRQWLFELILWVILYQLWVSFLIGYPRWLSLLILYLTLKLIENLKVSTEHLKTPLNCLNYDCIWNKSLDVPSHFVFIANQRWLWRLWSYPFPNKKP